MICCIACFESAVPQGGEKSLPENGDYKSEINWLLS